MYMQRLQNQSNKTQVQTVHLFTKYLRLLQRFLYSLSSVGLPRSASSQSEDTVCAALAVYQ